MNVDISVLTAILTTILASGVLMILIESLHLYTMLSDRYHSMIKPFMHKLTHYAQMLAWMKNAIVYKDKTQEHCMALRNTIEAICRESKVDAMDGRNLSISMFSAHSLNNLCELVNNVWYYLTEKKQYVRPYIELDPYSLNITRDYIVKSIKEISPNCNSQPISFDLLAEVSADFYCDVYYPIESVFYLYEYLTKKIKRFNWIVATNVLLSIVALILSCFVCICPIVIFVITVILSAFFLFCLYQFIHIYKKCMDTLR